MSNVFLHLVTQEGTSAMLLLANQVPCSQVRNILFCFITTLLAYQVAHKVNFFLQDWNISFNFLILRKQWLYYLHWVSVSVNGRLWTATRGKMQTECKCRLKTEDQGWNADWRLKITGYEKCVKFMNISGFSQWLNLKRTWDFLLLSICFNQFMEDCANFPMNKNMSQQN